MREGTRPAAAAAWALALTLLAGCDAGPLAPEPRHALVAIEPEGSGRAVVGQLELDAARPFLLRAVLVAEDWRGRPVYYTEAERLQIGEREIAADELRTWDRGLEARPLWFTVEGQTPYLEIADIAELDAFEFRENFRPGWPRAWTVPGEVSTSFASEAAGRPASRRFGTQRYHVRVELYGPESAVMPRARYVSPGAGALPASPAEVPAAIALEPAPLAAASRWFGLPQLEPAPGAPSAVRERILEWSRRDLAFSRAVLLREHLSEQGLLWDELVWQAFETDGSAAWGGPGDLLQAGGRVLVAYRDQGAPARLDKEDLVLDVERGARVLPLGRVFVGDGLVERAAIGSSEE